MTEYSLAGGNECDDKYDEEKMFSNADISLLLPFWYSSAAYYVMSDKLSNNIIWYLYLETLQVTNKL